LGDFQSKRFKTSLYWQEIVRKLANYRQKCHSSAYAITGMAYFYVSPFFFY